MKLKFGQNTRTFDLNGKSEDKLSYSGVGGLVRQYLKESSIHGAKYITLGNLQLVERIFWICSMLVALGFSVFLVHQVVQKFTENPIIISFQPREIQTAQIPFPAITLCNVNLMRRTILDEMLNYGHNKMDSFVTQRDKITLADLQETVFIIEQTTQYCLAAPSFRRLLNDTMLDSVGKEDAFGIVHEKFFALAGISNITEANAHWETKLRLLDYGHRSIMSCEDLIVRCLWAQKFIPCKDVFRHVRTEYGMCCEFNMMPHTILRNVFDDSYTTERPPIHEQEEWERFKIEDIILTKDKIEHAQHPARQKSGGKKYGLTILVNPDVKEYSTCTINDGWGFKLMAHSPISFPSASDSGAGIPINTEVFVEVDAQVTTADKQILGRIDVEKRGCYFPNDAEAKLTNYKFYSAQNCIDECAARETYKHCSCVQYYMPRTDDSQIICSSKQFICTENVRVNLMAKGPAGGQCSHCLPSCTDIKYTTRLSYLPMRDLGEHAAHSYNATHSKSKKSAFNYSIVHIFIGADSFNVKERKRLYDYWDLLANTGGLLGLTLGFSMISVLEIIYFFTFRAWFHLRQGKPNQEPIGTDDDKDNFYCAPTSSTKGTLPSILCVRSQEMQGFPNYRHDNSVFGY